MTAVRSLIVSTRDPVIVHHFPSDHWNIQSKRTQIGQTKFVARVVSFYETEYKALKQKLAGKMSHGWISSPWEEIF